MEYSCYMETKQLEFTRNIINIDLFLNKIIQNLQIEEPSKIILFGSYAKGEFKLLKDLRTLFYNEIINTGKIFQEHFGRI